MTSFFLNSILLGIGLAMDAFSVCLANGLYNSGMRLKRMAGVALVFGLFQFAMPLVGWLCVHTVVRAFGGLAEILPWVACILLAFLGVKMILQSRRSEQENGQVPDMTFPVLMMQGVATSIDALSVGFAIPDYSAASALLCSLVIGVETFLISLLGLKLGKIAGTRYSRFAGILGGVILVAIGISEVVF